MQLPSWQRGHGCRVEDVRMLSRHSSVLKFLSQPLHVDDFVLSPGFGAEQTVLDNNTVLFHGSGRTGIPLQGAIKRTDCFTGCARQLHIPSASSPCSITNQHCAQQPKYILQRATILCTSDGHALAAYPACAKQWTKSTSPVTYARLNSTENKREFGPPGFCNTLATAKFR
eukprot:SAG31_NODE_3310_length_4435_cov_3.950876_2_plen_171_part_00